MNFCGGVQTFHFLFGFMFCEFHLIWFCFLGMPAIMMLQTWQGSSKIVIGFLGKVVDFIDCCWCLRSQGKFWTIFYIITMNWGAKWGRWMACWFSSQMSSTPPRGTPKIRLTWLWRPSVRRYNWARVSLCTLRKQPLQQTRVRWGDFPLSRIQSYHIKSIRRNREAGLWCPEVFGPPDKHNNICVKPSHNQEEEETNKSGRG